MAKFYPPSITAAVRNRIALSAGEIVYDTTNKCLYVGDGETYGGIRIDAGQGISEILRDAANGFAGLDENGKISTAVLPESLLSNIRLIKFDSLSAFTVLPDPAEYAGKIVLFTGESAGEYRKGHFYVSVLAGEDWGWARIVPDLVPEDSGSAAVLRKVSSTVSGAYIADYDQGDDFHLTLEGDTVLTVINIPQDSYLIVRVSNPKGVSLSMGTETLCSDIGEWAILFGNFSGKILQLGNIIDGVAR